jgi:hypothetical protein
MVLAFKSRPFFIGSFLFKSSFSSFLFLSSIWFRTMCMICLWNSMKEIETFSTMGLFGTYTHAKYIYIVLINSKNRVQIKGCNYTIIISDIKLYQIFLP